MSPPQAFALILAGIALSATVSSLLRGRRAGWSRGRVAAVLLLQPLLALLFWLALWPPAGEGERPRLVVLTAGAEPEAPALAPDERLFALPDAPRPPGATPVPDLASLLRRHPQARGLRVLGQGLAAHDREAAQGWPLQFEAAPAPTGLVALDWPTRLPAGAPLPVAGRVAGIGQARLELRDPAGERVDSALAGEDGHFRLQAWTGLPGRVAYQLQLLDASGEVLTQATLPLQVLPGHPHRLWLRAGAPNAELKYLGRWALDAGLSLHAEFALGAGIRIGDRSRPVNAAELARTDLLILDERSWRELGPAGRAAVDDAVREGLGLLLRISGPLDAATRRELAERGFRLETDTGTGQVELPLALTPRARGEEVVPRLGRWPGRLSAPGGAVLLADARGRALAAWQARGRGRVGVWLLDDSYRWYLAGYPQAHGHLWARAVATLARPQPSARAVAPARGRVGERAALCGLGADAELEAPSGARMALMPDPATGPAACAAVWPREAGWHRLRDGGRELSWWVMPADALPGVQAQARRQTTLALAAQSPAERVGPAPSTPGPRWPWWAAWLALAALAWALERPRPRATRVG
ncbi:carboxypeptidase regulatory-like domain-containing protein [Arenimonas fontis]|uniref:Carboxypeptidase regulatory-like domain-containing protein n=1 Tax=Arenimonas fontis TaxID=2608255 RepID=A0A5B2ZCY1_9GAMM|nr:carboxypeptidase regulatory-like domain-containing protein [Arenimonas fontis]KAA2285060.1 carboxypeptidase regulatory-like domain-containing protein [Arenimonas fontis]